MGPAVLAIALFVSACSAGPTTAPSRTWAAPMLRSMWIDGGSKKVRIYLTNSSDANGGSFGSVSSYATSGGKPDRIVTESAGLDHPAGVAVDKYGKIYVTNYFSNSLFTFDKNGKQTTPTIVSGLNRPIGVAIDKHGKIYVANSLGGGASSSGAGYVATFNPDGTPSTPLITAGLNSPWGVAVDAKGKIYVSNYQGGNVTTYTAAGKATKPTIDVTAALTGIAVDAKGKIYVNLNGYNEMETYTADGKAATPTITSGLNDPQGIAIDRDGHIYVTNYGGNDLTTYTAAGKNAHPTIRHLLGPIGITLH